MDVLFCCMLLVSFVHVLLAAILIICCVYRVSAGNENRVCIVVMGDIGRSPRMQYHAQSFLRENQRIDFVGFSGSKPLDCFSGNDNITFHYLLQTPKKPDFLPSLLYYIFKTIYQTVQLLFVLVFLVRKPRLFLMQNPPTIPTMFVLWFTSRLKGCSFVIDWHNYGFSILAMNIKRRNHPLVKFACSFERFFGRLADANLCVTKAMKEDLDENWRVTADVLYDRPPKMFKRLTANEIHSLFMRLKHEHNVFEGINDNETRFTFSTGKPNADRPALLVSSTSWTEDEDFSILLDALKIYQERKTSNPDLPKLVCVITGKGPQKEYYLREIAGLQLTDVEFVTPWLTSEDYPRVIGSADIGVCLHTSSSELDLPMKVVDMFGCSLPVCAVDFRCLDELVQHNHNGTVFNDSAQLAGQLERLLSGFPNCSQLKMFRKNIKEEFNKLRWHENWMQVVSKLLK